MKVLQELEKIAKVKRLEDTVCHKVDGYLLGLKHGISLADLDHQFKANIKEIEDLRKMLREKKEHAKKIGDMR